MEDVKQVREQCLHFRVFIHDKWCLPSDTYIPDFKVSGLHIRYFVNFRSSSLFSCLYLHVWMQKYFPEKKNIQTNKQTRQLKNNVLLVELSWVEMSWVRQFLLQNFTQIIRNERNGKALYRIQKIALNFISVDDGICIRIRIYN